MKDRTPAPELAAEFHRHGDPTGWFEALYREAEDGKSIVPWAHYHPTPDLVSFWMAHPQQTAGKSALVTNQTFPASALSSVCLATSKLSNPRPTKINPALA